MEDHTPSNGPGVDTFTYYHMIQEENGRGSAGAGPALPALGHALAGGVATAAAKAVIYPLELVITRLQVQKQLRGKGEAESAAKDADAEYSGLIDAAKKIYNAEGGLRPFYSGVSTEIGKGIADSFLFFLAYNFLRQYELKRSGGKHLSIAKELGVGVAAGSFGKFLTTPIQNIVTRQQTAALIAARDPNANQTPGEAEHESVTAIAKDIYSERGLTGFWAGYPETVILTTNPAITFAFDNLLTRILPQSQKDNPSPQTRFLVSAVSKALASAITYPLALAKSRAQAVGLDGGDQEGAETGDPPAYLEKPDLNSTPRRLRAKRAVRKVGLLIQSYQAMYIALRRIYRTEGISGLYSGIEGEVLKGFLQHGLTMMVKEHAHVGVIQLYYFLLKATKRWPDDLQNAQQSVSQGTRSFASDAQERVVNVGETVSEGAKRMVERVSGRQSVAQSATDLKEGTKDLASDAQERAANVTETMSEGAKSVAEKVTGRDGD